MKKTFQTIVVLLTFACMAMVGCTDDWGLTGISRPSEVICFTATLDNLKTSAKSRSTSGHLAIEEEEWRLEGVATDGKTGSRGGLTTALEGKAGVIGIASGTLEFSFRGDELTSVGSPMYWKDMTKQNFTVYAFAPHNVTTNKAIDFTVADKVADQKDVIVATREVVYNADDAKSDFNKTIPLTFNHILTAVRFRLGFDATVKSITVSGVKNQGVYSMETGTWSSQAGTETYEITSIADGNELLMVPQKFTSDAKVTLVCTDGTTLEAPLDGQEWKPGKLITYTLYKGTPPTPIYLDLAAAGIEITGNTYSGAYYETNDSETKLVKVEKQTFTSASKIHVYQSTSLNQSTTGKVNGQWLLPTYQEVTYNGKPWRDFITNNTSVEDVIEAWDNAAGAGKSRRVRNGTDDKGNPIYKVETDDPNGAGAQGAVRSVGREATKNHIHISATTENVNLIIDNIYSSYQQPSVGRTKGSLAFVPEKSSILTINMKGDNRLGCIHYSNVDRADANQLVFEGTGSLTVASADYYTDNHNNGCQGVEVMNDTTYFSNHWCAAIGNNDSQDKCYGIVINSGTLFAGTTKAENCTAIGGGGNGYGEVTINGGIVTAVATTTGTAIGGGIGFRSNGGIGEVIINGGNVYAYNLANRWDIPSSAIGGAGTQQANGAEGKVKINGGYVYAYSALGTAIGGGSSQWKKGGNADVIISGGTVIAKTGSSLSTGIGGGTGNSGVTINEHNNGETNRNGGSANVTINGPAIVRTGSIGGGGTGNKNVDKIGSATIDISDGDIEAQCILAAGSGDIPKFTMSNGTIRNSNTDNEVDKEYLNVQPQGGAVYLEDGTCEISGTAVIENCTAETGGAIYIAGTYDEDNSEYKASFTMSGGTIKNCTSKTDGGAVYLKGGNVKLTGGTISDNLAQGGNGGALYLMEGNFEMSNATITKNSAMLRNDRGGDGGGVYITSSSDAKNDVKVTITSGSITSNTSDRRGGGMCVIMPEVSNNGNRLLADVTIGNESGAPNISANSAIMQGGGLYVEGNGEFVASPIDNSFYGFNTQVTINNGTVKANSTTAYVPNNDIVNEKGIVNLNGGDVPSSVTVTFHGNGGKTSDGEDKYEQKLVTSTNNILLLPDFTHSQNSTVRVLKWNTRADGQGEDYTYTNGASINLSESLELYAIWGR